VALGVLEQMQMWDGSVQTKSHVVNKCPNTMLPDYGTKTALC